MSLFKSKSKPTSESVERRSQRRHEWPLVLRCSAGSKVPGRTLDVSADSVRIITPRELKTGDEVSLELYLNESDIFSIRFQANCVWSREAGTEWVAGLDLSGSRPRNLELLAELVGRLS